MAVVLWAVPKVPAKSLLDFELELCGPVGNLGIEHLVETSAFLVPEWAFVVLTDRVSEFPLEVDHYEIFHYVLDQAEKMIVKDSGQMLVEQA